MDFLDTKKCGAEDTSKIKEAERAVCTKQTGGAELGCVSIRSTPTVVGESARQMRLCMGSNESAKREEFLTYKKLALGREHKSKALRRKVEQSRAWLYIGGKNPHRPYLKVPREEYMRVWNLKSAELEKRLRRHMNHLSRGELSCIKQLMLNEAVYDECAQKLGKMKQIEAEFYRQHGRAMTAHEESFYRAALDQKENESREDTRGFKLDELEANVAADPMRAIRKHWVADVIQKIRIRQRKGALDLQSIWAAVVGAETARDTFLQKIDALRGLAFCRCLSSTLLFELKRKSDLPKKLSAALGVKIQRIVFV